MQNPMQNRLRALMPSAKPRRPRIEAAAQEATVYIYDYVGMFGVEAEPLVREIANLTVPTIHVRINSPGGDVFDGLAIHNALKQHAARVVVHVDGLAASIASVIAMAGDEVRMSEGAFLMIHNAWLVAIGDAAELRKTADIAEQVNGSLVKAYAAKSGLAEAELLALMDEETWLDADQAVEKGFADVSEAPAAAAPAARYDLSVFAHVPEGLREGAPAPRRKIETVRDYEAFLRDEGGFSHAAAKAIAAGGFKQPSEPRDEDEGCADLVAALKRRGSVLANL